MSWLALWVQVAWAGAPLVADDATSLATALETRHDALVDATTWRSPTEPEREAVITLVGRIAAERLACPDVGALADLAARADLDVSRLSLGELRGVLLESPHGGGMMAVWCGEATELVVQAPHSHHDLDTDTIVRLAFSGRAARVAMWNTTHRYRAMPGEQEADPVHPADVVHHPTSVFHSVSLAWAATVPESRFVQVHGYGPGHTEAGAVLSSGSAERPPTGLVSAVSAAIAPAPLDVYGAGGRTLGGTTNVLARQLLRAPTARFVHLELARPARAALSSDAARTTALFRALGDTPWSF